MDWQDKQVCQCGHIRSSHDSEHSEFPTGTGHCIRCMCTQFEFSHQIDNAIDNIALFDMDGSLADFDAAMAESLNEIKSEQDEEVTAANLRMLEKKFPVIRRRMDLIKHIPGWWMALKPLPYGFRAMELAKEVGFDIQILTKGPKQHTIAWKEKIEWCQKHIDPDIDIHIVSSKSGHYGKVLYDDYPQYLTDWLGRRPRGLAIMPVTAANRHFSHPNLLRWDGSDEAQLRKALVAAYKRRGAEPLLFD